MKTKIANDIISGLGSRLRLWRKNLNPPLKAFELAKLIKVSQGSLSDVENGKSNPSALTILKLIENTDISIYWLMTGKSGDIKKGDKARTKCKTIKLNSNEKLTIESSGN